MFDSFDHLVFIEILKFLEIDDIIPIKCVNRYFYKLFPQEWLVNSLVLNDSTSLDNLKVLGKYIFLRNCFVSKLSTQKMVFTGQLRTLKGIDILFMDHLEYLDIQPIVSLEFLFISRCKNLKYVNISSECKFLKSITCSNTSLKSFEVKDTWDRLNVLDLSATKVKEIIIPQKCTQLTCIQSSNSALETCIVKSIVEKNLFISFYKNTHAHLDVFTYKENIKNTNISVFSAPLQTFEIKDLTSLKSFET